MSTLHFCTHNHLKKRKDFLAARNGLLFRTSRFILQARLRLPQDEQHSIRFGLTATRKIGNAVERNRMRRRLRAVIRQTFGDWISLPPLDVVLIVRPATLTVPFSVLESDFHRSLRFLKESLQAASPSQREIPTQEGQDPWRTGTVHLPQVSSSILPLSIL